MKAHRRLNKLTPLAAILSGILLTNIATAAPIKIADVKRAEPVDFDKEIVPMLEASCTSCHNVIVDEGGLNLETVKSILKGGKKGAVVVPGKPEASRLLQLAAHQKNPVMPPKNNDVEAPNLTPEQLGILKLWIAAGAKEGSGKSSAPIVWKPLPNLVQPIYSVSVTPDGTYAAAGRSNQVYIYEVATGRMLTKLTDPEIMKSGLYSESGFAHYDIVQSVAFSPDGLTLATSGFRTVKLWKRPENVQISKWQAPAAATTFATTSDAKFIALPVDGNQVKIFEAATGKEHKTLAGHTGPVKTLAFTPDNAKLVTGSEDKTIRVWDLASSKAVGQINTTGPVNALVIYNAGKNIAATGADNNIRTWETPAALPENEEPTKELATLTGHSQPINTLIPVPTAANQFLSGAKDGQMKLWDGTKAVRSFAHTGNVTAVAVSPDGQRFASVSESNTARIFDAAGKQIAEVSGDHRAQRELASITHALSRTTGKIGKTKSALQAAEKDLPTKEKAFNEKKAAKEKAEAEAKTKKDAFDKVKTQKDEADKLAVTTSEVTIKAEEDVKAKTAAKAKTDADAKAKKDALDKLKAQKATADKAVTAAVAVTTKAEATFKTAAAELAKVTEAHAKAVADLQAAQAELDKDKENADKKKKVADLTAAVTKADADKKAKDANAKNQEKARNDAKAKSDAATIAAKALEKPIADATAALTAADAAKKKGDTDLAASTKARDEAKKKSDEASKKVKDLEKPFNDANTAFLTADGARKKAEREFTDAEKGLNKAKELVPAKKTELANLEAQKTAEEASKADADKASKDSVKPMRAVAFSADSKTVCVGGDDQLIHVYSAENGKPLEVLQGTAGAISMLASAGGNSVVALAADKSVITWNENPEWTLFKTIGDAQKGDQFIHRVLSLKFSHNGKLLATGGGDPSRSGEVKVFDVSTGGLVREIVDGHSDTVFGLDFSYDDKFLVSGAADKFVKIWNLSNGELVRSMEGHTHHVLGVGWKDEEATIASCSADNTIKIWNADTGEQKKTVKNYTKQVTSLTFVGDTDTIATSGGDKTVRFHTAANGSNVRSFSGGTDFMYSVAATPDSSIVVAGGQDSTVYVWNGKDGKVIRTFAVPKEETKDNQQASAK